MTDRTPRPPLPLIPILRAGKSVPDRDDLATWHEALADAVGVELPHDLLALWLYPASGGVELIGPEALAQDDLAVPLPRPRLSDEAIERLVAVVARAYRSVACLPIRFGPTDVGLLLIAALEPDRFDADAREMLGHVADAIAPTFSRIARQQGAGPGGAAPDLGTGLAAAWTEARSPRDFFALASEIFGRTVPHDTFEVLIPGPSPGRQYRLGAHAGGPPWADSALTIERERLDLFAIFDGRPTLDLRDPPSELRLTELLGDGLPPGQAIRSLLGARVTSSGHLAGHVLVGSTRPAAYQAEDLAALVRLGDILGPKIDTYVLASQLHVLRKQMVTLRNAPAHHARVADMLATTAQFAEASRRLAEETRAMLPCDRLTLAVRLSDGDRVVLVDAGEAKHWSDLPLVPVAGTPLGRVLRGEVADVVTDGPTATELIVPLRVSGRTVGALVLAARGFGALGPGDVEPVQQLADLVAPHVELVRRAAMLPVPVVPGWKRVG